MKNLSYEMFFKAFSNKTRFEIIKLLRKGSKNVTEICNELGFEQSRVSHNLKCLIECGFVTNNKNGKERIYSLEKNTVMPMLNLIDKHIKKYSSHLKKCGIISNSNERRHDS